MRNHNIYDEGRLIGTVTVRDDGTAYSASRGKVTQHDCCRDAEQYLRDGASTTELESQGASPAAAAMLTLYRRGLGPTQIALEVGTTPATVNSQLTALRNRGFDVPYHNDFSVQGLEAMRDSINGRWAETHARGLTRLEDLA